MASERDKTEAPGKSGTGAMNIAWNDANLQTRYANVCNVSINRDEVTLLFGTDQARLSGEGEAVVQLTDRVVLDSRAAERLWLLLSKVVAEYEARFGVLHLETGG